jgi:alpha-ribazole phosphatase/probable phosphoglycerate mutase
MSDSSTVTTTVDLIRHGEPAGGIRFRGHTDDPLSETGWAQMRAAIQGGSQWDAVISSPLLRCAEFAAALAASAGVPLETEERFKEIGFGEWEGRTPEELMQIDPDCLDQLWRDPAGFTPPGGEGLEAFAARVTASWNDTLARHAGKKILLVAHGGVNRVILCHTLQIPLQNMFRLDVPFAALSRIRILGIGADALPQLVSHGSRQA